MADKPTKTPGSITAPADHKDQRISEISNVNRAISNMQSQIDQKMGEIDRDISSDASIASIQTSMNQVLRKLSMTVTDVSKGLSGIAWNLAKGSKDALAQTLKAAQDDVKYDPQKMLAMSLAKSSPIFGYYASRFVETDVFKNATARMKANISSSLSGVGGSLKSFFTGKEKGVKESKKIGKGLVMTKKTKEKIPKMAKGGVVGKGGLAQVHAAEVVMPIDKLLERMDKQISVQKAMSAHSIRWQTGALAKMDTYIGDLHAQQKVGLFKGFFKALQEVQTQYEEPSERRMLRSLLAIQSALGAQIGTWEQVWQKMMIEHPLFRTLLYIQKSFRAVFGLPFRPIFGFFKARGGYKGHLSKEKQPFTAMNENLGILYTGTMYRLDGIAMYTRATAEATRDLSTAITGTKYKPIEGIRQGAWTMFGKMRGLLNTIIASTVSLGGRLGSYTMGEGREERDEAIRSFASKLSKRRLAREVTKFAGLTIGKGHLEKIYGSAQAVQGSMDQREYEKYMPKQMARFAVKHDAMPVWIKGSIPEEMKEERESKLWEVQRELTKKEKKKEAQRIAKLEKKQKSVQDKLEKVRAKRRKAAQKEAKRLVRASRMAKGKGTFGFLGKAFKRVGGLLSTALMFILPMLFGFTRGGIGGIFKYLGSGLTGIIKGAFLGKGGIFKALLFKIKNIGSLLGGIVTKVFTNPSFLRVMAGAMSAALAFYLGWKIGKKIDDFLGISARFKNKLDEWDRKAAALSGNVSKKTVEQFKSAREGGAKGFEGSISLQLSARTAQGQEWIQDIGMWGESNQVAIAAAQRSYIQENIQEYMLYSPMQIYAARQEWLRRGGYGAKWMGTDAQGYGIKREKAFMSWLKGNTKYKPMTSEAVQQNFKKYQLSRGITGEYDPYVLDRDLSMRDRVTQQYTDKSELAKQEVQKRLAQAEATKLAIMDSTKKLIGSHQAIAKEGMANISQQTTILTNNIQSQTTTMMNSSGQMANVMSEYGGMLMMGEVDGDH
jgi:hypothetical protein